MPTLTATTAATTVAGNFMLDQLARDAVVLHPHLKQRSVQVRTEQGRVTIRGSVQSYFEKQMAQEALRHLNGVTAIENQLEVVWTSALPRTK